MKILLTLSVILNLILGYFLLVRKPEKEIIERERLIIETHGNQGQVQVEKTEPMTPTPPKNPSESKKKNSPPEISSPDQYEFQDAGEKMESDRTDFFSQNLGMNDEKIAEHKKIRDEFFKQTALFWKKNPMKELSLNERRKMLDLEEEFLKKLEKLHGKANWEKYQKFREDYNGRGYKRQMEEGQSFMFMSP